MRLQEIFYPNVQPEDMTLRSLETYLKFIGPLCIYDVFVLLTIPIRILDFKFADKNSIENLTNQKCTMVSFDEVFLEST